MPNGVVKIRKPRAGTPRATSGPGKGGRDGWRNLSVPPKGYRYVSLTTALPDMVDDFLQRDMSAEELFDKYIYLAHKTFTLASVKTLLAAHGAYRAKAALKKLVWGKGNAVRDGLHPGADIVEKTITAVADTMIDRAKAGANKHFDRVEKELDKVHTVLAKKKIGPKTVGRHLAEVDKFDLVARRTYKMDDQKEPTSMQWNIGVLLSLKTEDMKAAVPLVD